MGDTFLKGSDCFKDLGAFLLIADLAISKEIKIMPDIFSFIFLVVLG